MRQRISYIIISLSLIGLLPSIYGVIFCKISEQLIEKVPSVEIALDKTIQEYRNGKLICQPAETKENEDNIIVPKIMIEKGLDIRDLCSDFLEKGFTIELYSWMEPALKLDIGKTKHIKNLRLNITMLHQDITHMATETRNQYCYLDDDYFEEVLPPMEDNETYYQKILRERYEERYGEPLEQKKAKAQANFANHIATLQEYLDNIKAARLAHEPHRPMIRFIGWAWLIFESIGMILLFSMAYGELKKWRINKQSQG